MATTPAKYSPNETVATEARPFPALRALPDTEAPAPASVETPVTASVKPRRKRTVKSLLLPVIGVALLGAGGLYGYDYWIDGRFMISTDDAYVTADMAFVSPKISGYVDRVEMTENQAVKAGDPLVTMDDGDYRIALEQASAQIATAGRTLERITAQIEAARASQKQAEAQKSSTVASGVNALRAADRAQRLLKTRVATQAQVDDTQTAVLEADAATAGADAQIATAKANIGVLEAQYAEAQSTVRTLELAKAKAERDLSFTVLRAPYDGVIGNLSVEQGDLISVGQRLSVVVPMDKLYVVANFKETQLGRLAPGEKVRLTVDAIDDTEFEGTVSSLAPASGAVFSLLPPENATGNFTKVVQWVPVRIDVSEDAIRSGKLRAGLSVIVDVDSRTAPGAASVK